MLFNIPDGHTKSAMPVTAVQTQITEENKVINIKLYYKKLLSFSNFG